MTTPFFYVTILLTVQKHDNKTCITEVSEEEVISDIDEMMTDKKAVVGYYFSNPCRAILTTPEIEVDEIII